MALAKSDVHYWFLEIVLLRKVENRCCFIINRRKTRFFSTFLPKKIHRNITKSHLLIQPLNKKTLVHSYKTIDTPRFFSFLNLKNSLVFIFGWAYKDKQNKSKRITWPKLFQRLI